MNPSSATPPMRRLRPLLLLVIAVVLVAGCGSKGDLVLPAPPSEAPAAP